MLSNLNVTAVLGVKDLATARSFYEGTLGLNVAQENDWGVLYRSGNTQVYVYVTDNAGTNQATAASWSTDDVEGAVKELKGKGVTFEHYDMPGVTMEGDVHVMGEMRSAWFKDPDGNILCISNDKL